MATKGSGDRHTSDTQLYFFKDLFSNPLESVLVSKCGSGAGARGREGDFSSGACAWGMASGQIKECPHAIGDTPPRPPHPQRQLLGSFWCVAPPTRCSTEAAAQHLPSSCDPPIAQAGEPPGCLGRDAHFPSLWGLLWPPRHHVHVHACPEHSSRRRPGAGAQVRSGGLPHAVPQPRPVQHI